MIGLKWFAAQFEQHSNGTKNTVQNTCLNKERKQWGERGWGSEILEHSSVTNLTGSLRISTLVRHIYNPVGNIYEQLNIYKYEAEKIINA